MVWYWPDDDIAILVIVDGNDEFNCQLLISNIDWGLFVPIPTFPFV